MTRSTIKKLKRIYEVREAKKRGESWYYNPNGHPEPTIPSEDHLRSVWVWDQARCNPDQLIESMNLIDYVTKGKERR